MIKEFLHVKFGHSVLLHFDSADIDIIIEQLYVRNIVIFFFITFILYVLFV